MRGLITLHWVILASYFCLSCGYALKTFCPVLSGTIESADSNSDNNKICRPEKNEDFSNLICDGNFSIWSPGNLPNSIQSLKINGTKLERFPACSFFSFSIETIIIEENRILNEIDQDTFVGLKNVKKLFIRKNPKLDIQNLFKVLRDLNQLEELYLEENLIQWHEKNLFNEKANLDSLKIISLVGNPLKNISVDFFRPIQKSPLQELILQDCNIKTVESGKNVFLF